MDGFGQCVECAHQGAVSAIGETVKQEARDPDAGAFPALVEATLAVWALCHRSAIERAVSDAGHWNRSSSLRD